MCGPGNVYFDNWTNRVGKEDQVHIVKSNLVPRVEELVQDLPQLPIVLMKNRHNVFQGREVGQPEKLAEQLTALTISLTAQKQRNYYVLQVQKTNRQS